MITSWPGLLEDHTEPHLPSAKLWYHGPFVYKHMPYRKCQQFLRTKTLLSTDIPNTILKVSKQQQDSPGAKRRSSKGDYLKNTMAWNWWFQNMINYVIIGIHVIYFNLLLIEFFEKALGYKSKVPWLMEKDPEAQWQLQNVHIMFIVFHLLIAAILYESIGSLSYDVRGYILGDAGFLPPIANRYQ